MEIANAAVRNAIVDPVFHIIYFILHSNPNSLKNALVPLVFFQFASLMESQAYHFLF